MIHDPKKRLPSQDVPTSRDPQKDHIPEDATSIESSGGVLEPEAGAAGTREML